jgi:hypothetical protein
MTFTKITSLRLYFRGRRARTFRNPTQIPRNPDSINRSAIQITRNTIQIARNLVQITRNTVQITRRAVQIARSQSRSPETLSNRPAHVRRTARNSDPGPRITVQISRPLGLRRFLDSEESRAVVGVPLYLFAGGANFP